MRVALDAMGGDDGPRPAVEGALAAARRFNIDVLLVGKPRHLNRLMSAMKIQDEPRLKIVEATDVIQMSDSPRKSLSRKQSSLAISTDLVKTGQADALVSAGNTGAVLAHTLFSWRTVAGIKKPAIATFLPTAKDAVIVIDAGANVDCKPRQIVQFAAMGSVYARDVLKRTNPRIGLLSNGEEETKGNEVTVAAHQLLRQTDLNFLGNAEGRDVFTGDFDVIACDGFVGNVLLKAAEGLASTLFKAIKQETAKSIVETLGGLAMRSAARRVKKRTDYDEYGGAPLLGLNGIAIIGHGRSNAKAYMNALRVAAQCHSMNLVARLAEEVENLTLKIGEEEAEPEK